MATMEDRIYKIYFDEGVGCVVMEWNGYATSQQFKEGTELMLATLVENKCTKVLADIRDMVIIGREDQEWLDGDFLPRATHLGFRTIAMIKPHSYFNKVAVESVSYKIDKEKLSINFFDDRRTATEWLKNS